MSTPHISHLASTNPFSILSPSPQPTSSQTNTIDIHTIGGLRNVNMQLSPGRKDNHEGKCEVHKNYYISNSSLNYYELSIKVLNYSILLGIRRENMCTIFRKSICLYSISNDPRIT